MDSGIRIIDETVGSGAVAGRGDSVFFDLEITLNKGEIVRAREDLNHRLGRRDLIVGVEKARECAKEGTGEFASRRTSHTARM